MTDISHVVGSDLVLSATGDLLAVAGSPYGVQRVLRRLDTNAGDMLFHPEYGAGLPQFVGQPANRARIAAVIRRQMLLEKRVASTPAPTVSVTVGDDSVVTASIRYTDAIDGTGQALTTRSR
ncbi:MAG: hypothetical protein NVSMB20_03180 [Bradyrhizobium sp.]